ncbi:MAG: DUF4339 domain-containing protein [Verrucomicrobiales bacterium]|nr:DUF4339 domain-containing protein [Verrucomicrobiales bacterium]
MEWFYANENDEQIAVDESAIPGLVEIGTIKRDTLVWTEGMADWVECREVKPELFQSRPAAPEPLESDLNRPTITEPGSVPAPPPLDAPPAYSVRQPGPADNLALSSMICGIAGLVLTFGCAIGLPVSIAAVICGHKAKKKLEEHGLSTQNGQVTAGLITGYIGIGIGALIGVLFAFGMFAAIMEDMQ